MDRAPTGERTPVTADWPPPHPEQLPAGGWVWSDFSLPVYDFARILRAAGRMPDNEDDYWENPWKWDTQHQAWIATGEPTPPTGGTPPTLAWRRFLRVTTTT
jgi:hypothetical protein